MAGEKRRKATKEESEKKVNFAKVEEKKEGKEDFDICALLKDPVVAKLLDSGKDIFKKKETDPNVCEISIKAPSEVILKLFKLEE